MKASVSADKKTLVVEIPLEKPHASSTGKTLIVASSGGNVATSVIIDGKPVKVGLNAFITV
jgi:hypothetical protein